MNFNYIISWLKKIFLHFISSRSSKNIFWNFSSGIWLAILILISTPWYVSKLGLEQYGILSLWMVLQSMMNLLDFGLGATIIKEFASAKPNKKKNINRQNILKTFESFYWSIALIIIILLLIFSVKFSGRWFNIENQSIINIKTVMIVMSFTLFFQFPNVLYINGLIGMQDHRTMNILQIAGNTVRYGVGALILLWHNNLIYFFSAQIFVAAIQTFGTRYFLWKEILKHADGLKPLFKKELLRQSAKFSLGMALTSIVVVILSNIDRIAISKMLPTTDLGKYAIAFTGSGFLQLAIQPFYKSFFPIYSELHSIGDTTNLRKEYFYSCQLISIIIISMGCIGFFFADDIFYVWLGYKDQTVSHVFKLILVGVVGSGLGWLPAAFQQAHGWTGLHVKMMAGSVIIGGILMFFAIRYFGIIGGTLVWLTHGISEITLGLYLMHRKLLTGELFRWYLTVLIPPLLLALPFSYITHILKPDYLNRVETFMWFGVSGLILVIIITLTFYKKLITSLSNQTLLHFNES